MDRMLLKNHKKAMLIFLFFPFVFKRVVYAPFVGEFLDVR